MSLRRKIEERIEEKRTKYQDEINSKEDSDEKMQIIFRYNHYINGIQDSYKIICEELGIEYKSFEIKKLNYCE